MNDLMWILRNPYVVQCHHFDSSLFQQLDFFDRRSCPLHKNFKIAALFGTIFFIIGIAWGSWHQRAQVKALADSVPLRVLCPDKWLDQAALDAFGKKHKVRIEHFTYSAPNEFLRQMANTNGKIDVICSSSFLVKSLIRSRWLKSMDYAALPNMKMIAVDFSVLPYDPQGRYTVPLFWNLYGFFGKREAPKRLTWREAWESQKLTLWAEELNLLNLIMTLKLTDSEKKIPDRTQSLFEDTSDSLISTAFQKFSRSSINFFKPSASAISAEAMVANVDWIQIPLARVARLLEADSPYQFWLPDEGTAIEVGVLSIGEASTQPALALQLINELIATPHALQTHTQMEMGVVHGSLSGLASIARLQKPEALREFPLNKFLFPDLELQDLPKFQKIFNEQIVR